MYQTYNQCMFLDFQLHIKIVSMYIFVGKRKGNSQTLNILFYIVSVFSVLLLNINLCNKLNYQMDPSGNKGQKSEIGRWTTAQHQRFMMGITLHGKDWKKVEETIGTRNGAQVRSHAQKFFNKLKKEENKKNNKIKGQLNDFPEASENENSYMKMCPEDFSNSTPIQLVSMIRKQSEGHQKINLSNFQKKLNEMSITSKSQQKPQEQKSDNMSKEIRHNSYQSLNNILTAYQNVRENAQDNQLQDESFLINLTKRYKKYFAHGGMFQNLIDFGNSKSSLVQNSIRKKSFTLPEGVQGDEDELIQRKKRVITKNKLQNQCLEQKQHEIEEQINRQKQKLIQKSQKSYQESMPKKK